MRGSGGGGQSPPKVENFSINLSKQVMYNFKNLITLQKFHEFLVGLDQKYKNTSKFHPTMGFGYGAPEA